MNMPDGEDLLQVAEQFSKELCEALAPAIKAIIEVLKSVAEALRPLVKFQLEQRNYILMMMSDVSRAASTLSIKRRLTMRAHTKEATVSSRRRVSRRSSSA